jgi:glycine oxidase
MPQVDTQQDVIVIGGGAVGACCARELAVTGRKVLVLDRLKNRGDAWRAAAGMLAPQIEAYEGDELFELGLASRERYHHLAEALRESTGIDIGLWQSGIARLAMRESQAPDLKSKVAWQRQQGHLCDWFDGEEVRARWPWLGPTHGALWAPRDCALHPERTVQALLTDAERLGSRVVQEEVTGLDLQGDRVIGVVGKGRYGAAAVIICAGAWSARLTGLPRPLSVEPIRGQMVALPWPQAVPPAIVYSDEAYLVARGGEALAGSTMEHAGFVPEVSATGLAKILAGIGSLCPGWGKLELTRTWAGLRPVTPDGMPIIGREPRVEGLWYATGHGRNGILLAAITGQIIAKLLAGENEIEHLPTLRPERFWNW